MFISTRISLRPSFNHFYLHISSASDLSEEIIYDSWSILQSDPNNYESLIQQYVVKALDWLQKKSIEISKIGNICNILRYTNGVRLKEEFCVRLIYCLVFALEATHQNEFAQKVNLLTISLCDLNHVCFKRKQHLFGFFSLILHKIHSLKF